MIKLPSVIAGRLIIQPIKRSFPANASSTKWSKARKRDSMPRPLCKENANVPSVAREASAEIRRAGA
jgi:hypothetical protein